MCSLMKLFRICIHLCWKHTNICGKIWFWPCQYVLIWMIAITGSHLSGQTICSFGWGGNEGLPQSLPYPLVLQSLRKDLVFNSWLDRIFSTVCKCSDTPSSDNLPNWESVFASPLALFPLWETHTCTVRHTSTQDPCVPSHLAAGLLTHCDRAIIRSNGLSIRN